MMQPPRHLDPSLLKQAQPLKPYLDNYLPHNTPEMQKDAAALGSFSNFPLSTLTTGIVFQSHVLICGLFRLLLFFMLNFIQCSISEWLHFSSLFLHLYHQAWTLTWMYPWTWGVVVVAELWATKSHPSLNWRNFGLLTLWSRTAKLVNCLFVCPNTQLYTQCWSAKQQEVPYYTAYQVQ